VLSGTLIAATRRPPVTAPANAVPIAWPDTARERAFAAWFGPVASAHGLRPETLRSASSDASFRRYFRVDSVASDATAIVMDAPPPQEDVRPFIHVSGLILRAGLSAPRVMAEDSAHGFLLLDDLGTELYLPTLQAAQAACDQPRIDALMRGAVSALVRWQVAVDADTLPPYDDALLRRELALFPEWCVGRELRVAWSADETALWNEVCDLLVTSALAQPTVAVHRDYMPRNLIVCRDAGGAIDAARNPGILDFQDAVAGPVGYDVASLLRDAFLSWDEEQELDWGVRYWQAGRKAQLPLPQDFGEFWRQVEWIGLQRHLKVLGIFCRLKHRDGKPAYSADLPRFFAYAHKVSTRYNALRPFGRLIEPLMGATRVEGFY
jgi:N-acetylmuramate 1-kinase